MKMAVLTGNDGVVKIDNAIAGGSLETIAGVRSFSIDITSDTIETSVMGDDTRTYVRGMSSWSGSADIYVDTKHLTGGANAVASLNGCASGAAVGDSPLSLEVYLNGSANKYSGEIIVTGFSVASSMDGMVEGTISFQGSGDLTFAVS
jgi:predicted secreted protein